jgi:hypothetical protein
MTNSMLEGFGLKDKVTFDQLPEQIQEYYVGPKYGTEESLWLKETHAVLMFLPQPPYAPWVDYWEKAADDNWVLAQCEKGAK